MIKRLSLKQCWQYSKEELIPKARTNRNIFIAFCQKKAMNIAFYYWRGQNINKVLKPILFIEMHIWSFIEFHITRKFKIK